MTKIRKLRRSMIIAAAYLVILAVLLTGMTSAKYTESKTVYTSFGAASFNTVLLGGNANNEIKSFTSTLDSENTAGLLPGMQTLTYPFSVANGVTDANVSEVAVGYTIRLYSNGTLPLKYTLKTNAEGDDAVTYFTKLESDQIIRDTTEGSAKWFEYGFYTDEELTQEAAFDLKGNEFEADAYQLMVDWPVGDDEDVKGGIEGVPANSSKYMKEVEIFEVLVTAASKNMLETEDYAGSTYTIPESELYGTGLIIVADPAGTVSGTLYSYSYGIDYRAFHIEDGQSVFNFNVDNGKYMGRSHEAEYTWYTVKLMVPYNSDTKDYLYYIETEAPEEYNDDGILQTSGPPVRLEISSAEYRKYDRQTGNYEVLETTPIPAEGEGAENNIMVVYTFAWPEGTSGESCGNEALMKLKNTEVNVDGTISFTNGDSNSFRLILAGSGNCTGVGSESTAVVNRMSLQIYAVDSDTAPLVMTPADPVDADDPEPEPEP